MDGDRFDRVVVALATAPSRRRIIRLLAVGAVGTLAGALRSSGHAEAQAVCADGDIVCPDSNNAGYHCCPGTHSCCGDRYQSSGFDIGCCAPGAICCPGGTCCDAVNFQCGTEQQPCVPTCVDWAPYGYPDPCPNADGYVSCTNTKTDNNHCGACGNVCPEGRPCQDGECACPDGGTECGGRCTDTDTDAANCGGCGNACPEGEACEDGACGCGGQSCDGACCDGACVDTQTDAANCGGCGGTCRAGIPGDPATAEICDGGRCVCPQGTTYCDFDGGCFDLLADHDNCGSCGNLCPGDLECIDGDCACPDGLTRCDDFGSGECADLDSSDEHCGACGNRCAGGAECVRGACRCPRGEEPCRGRVEGSGESVTVCCNPGWDCRKGRCCKVRGEECKRDDQCCSGDCRRKGLEIGGWQKVCR